jgi:glycosyltransferase involved in cell wall biosynthesis
MGSDQTGVKTGHQEPPPIIIASLMRMEGTSGLQTHMREFESFLKEHKLPYEVATPFFAMGAPLLSVFLASRKALEWVAKPAAVWLYRSGHGLLLRLRLRQLMARHPRCTVYAQCPLSAAIALRCAHAPEQSVNLVIHFNLSQADEWVEKGAIAPDGPIAKGIRRLEQSVLPRVHGMVYVSKFMQNALMQRVPNLKGVRSAVIPNFVKAPNNANAPLASSHGRDLISIGTLEPRKNQQFLLHVLAQAKSRGHVLRLTLVGDGPDRSALEALALKLGVAEQVLFIGFSSEARAHVPGHRLYVHSAHMENLPLALIEALSAGVPIVAAQVGGIGEVFREGIEGRFWPLDDAVAACDVLVDILTTDGKAARMGQAALLQFQTVFEASAVGHRLYTFLLDSPK